MGKYSIEFFVGMDVSDKIVEICILPRDAEEGKSLKVKDDRRSLIAFAVSFEELSAVKL